MPEIRRRARAALVQAGERAAALAAPEEAQRHLDQAAGLATDDARERAELLDRAGRLAFLAGRMTEARERLEQAIAIHRELGDEQAAVRAGVTLADVDVGEGRLEDAAMRFEAALPTLEQAGPSLELAAALAQLGRMLALQVHYERAAAILERALQLAEELALDEVFLHALISKASVLVARGRSREARLILEGAERAARAADLPGPWWRASNNLAVTLEQSDLYAEAVVLTDEIARDAAQKGNKERFASARFGVVRSLFELGRWHEAIEREAEAERVQASRWARGELMHTASILCEQGRLDAARARLAEYADSRESDDPQSAMTWAAIESRLLRAEGRPADALAVVDQLLARVRELSVGSAVVKRALVEALEAALALDDLAKADELLGGLDALPPGQVTPLLAAHRARFHARVGIRRGLVDEVETAFREAEDTFAGASIVFDLAVTRLEHAEWLLERGRNDEAQPLAAAARASFEALDAAPWLARVDQVAPVSVALT